MDSIININDNELLLVDTSLSLNHIAEIIVYSSEQNIYTSRNYTAIAENVSSSDLADYLLSFDKDYIREVLKYLYDSCPESFDFVNVFKLKNLQEYYATTESSEEVQTFCIVSNEINFYDKLKKLITDKKTGKVFLEKLKKKPGYFNAYIKPVGYFEALPYREAFSEKSWEFAFPILQFE